MYYLGNTVLSQLTCRNELYSNEMNLLHQIINFSEYVTKNLMASSIHTLSQFL
jgi:hypothetical protein